MAAEILVKGQLVSIVSPVYNAQKIIGELVRQIDAVCKSHGINYEIVLVDDNSSDSSWAEIVALAGLYNSVNGYRLSRNFGQHYSITAGLTYTKGDYAIVMDCDLQDNPSYIPELIAKSKEGYEVVCTIKAKKKHSVGRRISSDMFFFIVNYFSDVKLEKNLGGYTLLTRKCISEFLRVNDYHRHFSLIVSWLGLRRGYVKVTHNERFEGKSSYNIRKLLTDALDGVISQSGKLLQLSIYIGLIFFTTAMAGVVLIVLQSFYLKFELGWPSLIVLLLFSTGIVLFMLGIFGLYLGKVFDQVKNRPLFVVQDEVHSTRLPN